MNRYENPKSKLGRLGLTPSRRNTQANAFREDPAIHCEVDRDSRQPSLDDKRNLSRFGGPIVTPKTDERELKPTEPSHFGAVASPAPSNRANGRGIVAFDRKRNHEFYL